MKVTASGLSNDETLEEEEEERADGAAEVMVGESEATAAEARFFDFSAASRFLASEGSGGSTSRIVPNPGTSNPAGV